MSAGGPGRAWRWAALGALAAACQRDAPATPPAVVAPAPAVPAAAAPEVETLIALPVSAFHAAIVAGADGAADLLTDTAAYRLSPGQRPVERALDLGYGAAVTRRSYVYWSRGALRETPKADGPTQTLAPLPERPQLIRASEAGVAWLRRSEDGRFSLQALRGKRAATVYTSAGTIDALAIAGDTAFFVERPPGAAWRIGAARLPDGPVTFTAPRPGRAPAMLAAGHDLAFYLGAGFEVRRLSFDLQHERTVASDFICSPLAVADAVYCSQPDGIFQLRLDSAPRRLLPGTLSHPVADLSVGPKTLYWIIDDGPDRLQARAMALPP
jgi:hypothetical protein